MSPTLVTVVQGRLVELTERACPKVQRARACSPCVQRRLGCLPLADSVPILRPRVGRFRSTASFGSGLGSQQLPTPPCPIGSRTACRTRPRPALHHGAAGTADFTSVERAELALAGTNAVPIGVERAQGVFDLVGLRCNFTWLAAAWLRPRARCARSRHCSEWPCHSRTR